MAEALNFRKTRFSFESSECPQLASPEAVSSMCMALSERSDRLAVLSDTCLYLLEGELELAAPASPVPRESIACVDFAAIADTPTKVLWITHQVVGVGFRSGCIRCYDTQGQQICIHQPHNTPVKSLRKKSSLTTDSGHPSAFAASLWVLYEGGVLASIPIYALAAEMSPSEVPYQLFKLLQHPRVSDFVLGGESYLPLGEFYPDRILNNVFVGGQNPTIAMYHIGGPRHFQTLGKLATYVKDRVATAVTKAIGGFWSNIGIPTGSPKHQEQAREQEPCTSMLDFEDPDRVVERVSVDPFHKLIVTTDSLGRVMLFDARTMFVIRLWKGIRDAQFAWHETVSGSTTYGVDIPTLCLIIHAPRTGLITLWAMRHGPCLRTIPIGQHAQVFTVFQHRPGKRQAKCGILHADGTKLNLELLDLTGGSAEEAEDAATAAAAEEAAGATEPDLVKVVESLSPQTPLDGSGAEARALAVISATLGIQVAAAKEVQTGEIFSRVHLPDDIESRIWDEVMKIGSPQGLLRLLNTLEDAHKITLSTLLYRKIYKRCEEVAQSTESKKLLSKSTNRARLLDAYVTLLDVSPPPPPVAFTQIEQSWGGKNPWRQEALAWGSRVLQADASEQLAIVDAGGREPVRSNSGNREQKQEDPDDDGFHDAAGEVQQATGGKSRRSRNHAQSGEGSDVGMPSPRITFNVYDVSIPFEDFCMAFAEPHEGDGVFNIRPAFNANVIELSQLRWDTDASSPFSTVLVVSSSETDDKVATLQKCAHVLCLLLRPLLCDVFAIQNFAKAVATLKLPANDILEQIGPFLSMLSMPVLFASLMSRPKTSCPWQRWLKEVCSEILEQNGATTASGGKHTAVEALRQSRNSQATPPSPTKKSLIRRLSDHESNSMSSNAPKSTFGEATPWSPVTSGNAAGRSSSSTSIPTSSMRVAAFLLPLLLHLRAWRQLEHAFVVGSMVIEVLEGLSEQLERRTYGEEDLALAVKQWCMVLRQVRVALLLSCREDSAIPVSALDDGEPSIFRLLAKDTLRFANDAEAALTHEIRCQELIAARAVSKDKKDKSSKEKAQKPMLAAWDPSTDERWQEILAIVQTEDESPMLVGKASTQARRRPLLLYFPAHNQPHILGAHRAMLLAERWAKKPTRSTNLPLAIMHMERLPPFTRAGVALWMWTLVVAPFLRECWAAATSTDESSSKESRRSSNSSISSSGGNSGESTPPLPRRGKYLPHKVVASPDAAADIFQAAMDLLAPMQLSDMGFVSTVTPPRTPLMSDMASADLDDPDSITIWPKDKDQPVTRWTKTIREASVPSAAIQAHRTALLLMLVRAQARIRKPVAELVAPPPVVDELFQPHALQHPSSALVASVLEDGEKLMSRRKAFLTAAFHGIGAEPSLAAYRLAEEWNVPLQQVRSLHITALISMGYDELAAEVMTKVDDIAEISGNIVQTVRQRLGFALLAIEKNPTYAMLLASLDADICEWVRAKVRGKTTDSKQAIAQSNLSNFTATRNLLLRLMEVLKDDSAERQQVSGLLAMCTSLAQSFG